MAEKEYIEREALVKRLKKEECDCEWLWDILDIPTADVAPVRHRRWVIIEILCGGGKERKYFRCSECNKANVIRSNYCPNCGARMDGENNDT